MIGNLRSFVKELNKTDLVAFISALFAGAAMSRYLSMGTANPYALVFLLLLFPAFRQALKVKSKRARAAGAVSGLFMAAACFLNRLEGIFANTDPLSRNYDTFIYIAGFMCLFVLLSTYLYDKLRTVELTADRAEPSAKRKAACFFISMGIMLICWLPYYLLLYPGDITTDSISELNQAWGNEALSNHHPIAHTAMIRVLTGIGQGLFHDDTKAAAFYSVCQMLLLSAAFSYLIVTLYKLRVRKRFFLPMLALFAILPYNGVYSVTMWKDIPFGMLVLTFSVTLWRALMYYKAGRKMPVFEAVMLFVTGIGVCLFRSNGLYAFMFLFVFMLIFCVKLRKFLMLGIAAASLVIALIVKGPVYKALDVAPPDTIESLSLPAQQIAAVIRDGEQMTAEQWALLDQVVDLSRVGETYAPNISDPIKNLVRETDNQQYIADHKGDFLKLWIDLGLKYPKSYILAHILLTNGYWNPDIQYWVYSAEFRSDNFNMVKESKLSPELSEWLMKYRENYHTFHYVGLFWSIGLMIWIMVFMLGAAFVKKRRSLLMCYLPVLGVWLTLLIATPVFAEFRYAYSIFMTVPLLCFIPFVSEKHLAVAEAEKADAAEADKSAAEKTAK